MHDVRDFHGNIRFELQKHDINHSIFINSRIENNTWNIFEGIVFFEEDV